MKTVPRKVLLVDDHTFNRKLLRLILEGEGFKTLEASDRLEALRILEQQPVDAILSDILMPQMDGYILCDEVRRDDRLKQIPCIVYNSSCPAPADDQLALDFRSDRSLQQPYPPHAIINALRGILPRNRSHHSAGPPASSKSVAVKDHTEVLIAELEERNRVLQFSEEECERTGHELLRQARELGRVKQRLRDANEELEMRVLQRTTELEAVNKELESFSSSVSHDLRAPLRHLIGFAEMVEEDAPAGLDEKSRRNLATITESGRRMEHLIEDLLAFSRTAKADLRSTNVSLAELVRQARADLSAETEGRKIDWKIGPLPEVYADRSLLRQVVLNLLSNAVKYTRKRAPAEIEIGCAAETREMVFSIRDNGVGFDMKYADKLFGVFQRLHKADEFEGTGIGLANVQRIIHRHGGRTWAEGAVDRGATFHFSLPHAPTE
jgi:signal transduction histidine kinase